MTKRITEADLDRIEREGERGWTPSLVEELRRLRGLIAEADDALQNAHDRLQRLDGRGGDRLHSLDHGRGENDDACEICAPAVRAEARAIREEQRG